MKILHIAILLGIPAFCTTAFCEEEYCGSCEDVDACLSQIHELKTDINLLNLINGLHLTEDQIRTILKEARRMEKDLAPLAEKGKESGRDLDEELKILRSVHDSLMKGRKVPSSLKARYDGIEERRSGKHARRFSQRTLEKLQVSVEKVQNALTPAQHEVLSTYKPCLIPPKNLKDPVRVGQAKDTGPLQRYLEEVRELPDPVYERHIQDVVEQVVKKAEHHVGVMKEEEREEFRRRVMTITERVRGMDDVDFALEKAALAEALAPEDRAEALKKDLADMGVARYRLEGKITQFLLNPRIIPLLEGRLKRAKKAAL